MTNVKWQEKSRVLKIVFAIIICALSSAVFMCSCGLFGGDSAEDENIPESSYFRGNVFQIIVKDLNEEVIATGSGFVFNSAGWFVTNSHVMDEAYYADGIFNIPNYAEGESFTTLKIEKGYYNHTEKDIFIGKLTGYSAISSYYRNIGFTQTYNTGDVTYSVGYPLSSIDIEVNKGRVIKDMSFLYDKVYSGVNYISTSSYCAPGSSGGILINENLEVLGITCGGIENDDGSLECSLAISTFNFKNQIDAATDNKLVALNKLLHSDELTYISFYEDIKNDSDYERIVDSGKVRYRCEDFWEGENDSGYAYRGEETLTFGADGYISFIVTYYWDNGDSRDVIFVGYFSDKNGIDDLSFLLRYKSNNGNYFVIVSYNINYSENENLTLLDYEIVESNYKMSDDDKLYTKQMFNAYYENLYNYIFN